MKPSDFISKQEEERILASIREAETSSSGEIRVHLEKHCPDENVLDRAAYVFQKLGMHKTELRNGVLFYLAVEDKKFAILGDAGINAVTPDDFWDRIRDHMREHFAEDRFVDGLEEGIRMAGEALKEYFPYQEGDINELSNEISSGKI
ncbi:MAG TPA: TPM domain-containing protein [Bacteroidetes bacterium]|nr:TPM domain-containing protein [Bacteroidota bacterium]